MQEPAVKHPRDHYQYELCGVVVHSGSAFAGHYYSYIKARRAVPRRAVRCDVLPAVLPAALPAALPAVTVVM